MGYAGFATFNGVPGVSIPEPIEPEWKTELRLIRIPSDSRATGVKAFFDKASFLALQFPHDSVVTYAVRKIVQRATILNNTEWEVVRSSLLRFAMAEPTMLPALLELFQTNDKSWETDSLSDVLAEVCLSHAPFQHGFEVAWSLWMARALSINLPKSVSAAVKNMDDDIVPARSRPGRASRERPRSVRSRRPEPSNEWSSPRHNLPCRRCAGAADTLPGSMPAKVSGAVVRPRTALAARREDASYKWSSPCRTTGAPEG